MNEDAAEEQVGAQEAALGVGWAQGRMAAGRRAAPAVPVSLCTIPCCAFTCLISLVSLILQMRKLKLRNVKQPAQRQL